MKSHFKNVFSLLFLLFNCSFFSVLNATIAPSLSRLIYNSHVIITGRVVDIINQGTPEQKIWIKPEKILKGNIYVLPEKILLHRGHFPGRKGNTDFKRILESSDEYIFLLRYLPDDRQVLARFHLGLTDAWFGIRKSSDGLVTRIKNELKLIEDSFKYRNKLRKATGKGVQRRKKPLTIKRFKINPFTGEKTKTPDNTKNIFYKMILDEKKKKLNEIGD
ncbi:hypothetical protein ACFL35_12600 [Candidatus Riflebacteria bacterium]